MSPPATAALGVTTIVSTVGSASAVRMFIVADPHVIALAAGCVGACVGADDGAVLGVAVGAALGPCVACVGADDGAVLDGARVGATDGTDVLGAAIVYPVWPTS